MGPLLVDRWALVTPLSKYVSDTQEFYSKATSLERPGVQQERGISFHKLYLRPIDLEIIPPPVNTNYFPAARRRRVEFISIRSAFKAAHLEKHSGS
jgi:hypothetical protein